MNTRALACQIITDIILKKSSLLTLDKKLKSLDLSSQDTSFVKALSYSFFRYYYSLEQILKPYINKKTKLKVKVLLMLGALQILTFSQPEYATINEMVNSCKSLKIDWAKSLINAVLREISRNKDSIQQKFIKLKDYDLPQWLIDKLKHQYPYSYHEIIRQSNIKAGMFIRLNTAKNPNKVLEYLQQQNISYSKTNIENCILLEEAIDVKNNTLFKQGYFTVQDKSAQNTGHITAPLLHTDVDILDACAAPGGKTTHLLEIQPDIKLTAIDSVDTRLKLLEENIARISNTHNNTLVKKHDLTKKLENIYNLIILDAPCSATGVIRRNPDIKVLRDLADINNITKIQQQILQNLWQNNLKQQGYLLYITCSILNEENELQIKNFLVRNPNAQIMNIESLKEYKKDFGYQILPSENEGDGFYFCLINKQ